MWRPPINFVTLHYAYIILIGLLAFPILYPGGKLSAVDTYHFGVSASTESGLNTVDLKDLKTYQQLYLYFVPTVTNIGFINIIVVVVRLFWFRKHLKKLAPHILEAKHRAAGPIDDTEAASSPVQSPAQGIIANRVYAASSNDVSGPMYQLDVDTQEKQLEKKDEFPSGPGNDSAATPDSPATAPRQHITFAPSQPRNDDSPLYIPGPRERDMGAPLRVLSKSDLSKSAENDDDDKRETHPIQGLRRRRTDGSRIAEARSIDRVATVASSVFVLGGGEGNRRRTSISSQRPQQPALNDKPFLSRQATLGRNSRFMNLTSEDREALGGIEYRSLKLLLKIIVAYFVGLHVLGAICLLPWIKLAPQSYKDALKESAISETWWAFYSAQTMVNNLGFTLTPDSMITFRDAIWPMLSMSFLAFAGNTFYPVFLRLFIWTLSKIVPKSNSNLQEPLNFLLEHPRRCYTLLFPSKPTWVLFAILFALNFIDTLLIIVLDLHNPEVTVLPVGNRILAALFQAASARHTGTATFVLSEVAPGVQFSLLVMMYISVFPIAIAIRASNTYEERSLGIYEKDEEEEDEGASGTTYLLKHMQNQLSFDLWYVFLGIFCIAVAEAERIKDLADPAFNMFAIFFEVTSAYANVGLSLGYPDVNVSLCGTFNTFSKIVICIMMIRGRHRGLPYRLDRAIMLPDEHLLDGETTSDSPDE